MLRQFDSLIYQYNSGYKDDLQIFIISDECYNYFKETM